VGGFPCQPAGNQLVPVDLRSIRMTGPPGRQHRETAFFGFKTILWALISKREINRNYLNIDGRIK
jgi:hypothetical protein